MTSSRKSNPRGCGLFYLFIFLWIYGTASGQLNLDFNKKELINSHWIGDTEHFIINDSGMLQLKAPFTGTSAIFTKYRIPGDSLQLNLFFRLDFAPSNENMAKIFLMTNEVSGEKASGYYLKLGENGSQDAIQWWKMKNGVHQLLASCKMGGISNEPAMARVMATWHASGLCIISTDYEGKAFFEEDAVFSDQEFIVMDSVWFGIECKYTASRKDKFTFDDILISTITPDTIAPQVISVNTSGDHQIVVEYSEVPERTTASSVTSYTSMPYSGEPDEVIFPCMGQNKACLVYDKALESGVSVLHVSGVKDNAGNYVNQQFPYVHASRPLPGDLVLTEILTNPYLGGQDFLELYNNSDKFLLLDSLEFINTEKEESRIIRTQVKLSPGDYIAISGDTRFLKSAYLVSDTANMLQANIPSMNIESAAVILYSWNNQKKIPLDSIVYHEKMHSVLLTETKGVSLEKIKLSGPSLGAQNWHSASSLTNFGTPGFKNSVQIEASVNESCEFCFFTDQKIFSPDGDGSEDYLSIQYRMKKPGCKASLLVFDAEGYPAAIINSSVLLGTDGAILWDGDDGSGQIVRNGLYIILCRWFHPDGETGTSKHVVALVKSF